MATAGSLSIATIGPAINGATVLSAQMQVLLVEDDLDVAAGIADYLEAHQIVVDFAYNAAQANARLHEQQFDAIVLDINLPDQNGLQLCQQWQQQQPGLPVLFLTARDELDDKLAGFAAGALDYLVKPFAPAELLARLQVVAKQKRALNLPLQIGEFSLQTESGEFSYQQKPLQLHAVGKALIATLMSAYPAAVSKQALTEQLWPDEDPEHSPLRAHIYSLRQQCLSAWQIDPIETVKSIGYRFRSQP